MLDVVIVLAFVIYAVTAGFRARRKASRSLREYFLAGHTVPGWKAGVSMAATQFAADTPLLVTGLIATGGVYLLWRLWIYGLAFLLMAFVLAALWRRSGVLTDAELTEIRYSGRGVLALRVLKAFYYGTIINCVVLAMVLVAAVRIAEVFLPWHEWLPEAIYQPLSGLLSHLGVTLGSSATGLPVEVASTNNLISIVLIVVFTALYSMTGGLRSVIATDVVQFGLAMVGTVVYAILVIHHVGGLGELSGRLVTLYGREETRGFLSFFPPSGEVLLPFLTIIGLQWFFQMNSDGTGYLAQRSMACRTDADARTAGVVFAWSQILARSLIWLVIGVGLLVVYPIQSGDTADPAFTASREVLFVTGIEDLLPVGIRGLMLTGLLAALASTIDTHLNWGASYWSNDLYQRLICERWLKRRPSNRELVLSARLSNGVILTLAIIIMANLGSIQTAWHISLLFGAGMGSVLVLRWLWERINLFSEVAAIAVSLVLAPVLLVWTDTEWIRLAAMAAASTLAAVVVTTFTPTTDPDVLAAFFKRVRPSGLWRRTAQRVGRPANAPLTGLLRGLWITATCAASLFLFLFGFGKLLLPMPGESMLGPWLSLVTGCVLIPIWWRAGFQKRPLE